MVSSNFIKPKIDFTLFPNGLLGLENCWTSLPHYKMWVTKIHTFFDLKVLVPICPGVNTVVEQHAAKTGQMKLDRQ